MKSFFACPCCSQKDYASCCKVFHEGALPTNALQLMRARYCAYALNISDYLVATTHPASPHYVENKFIWKRNLSNFSKQFVFQGLEILDFQEKISLATVTFIASLAQGNRDATFTERSYFEKFNNRWLYRSGQLKNGKAPSLIMKNFSKVLPLAYYGEESLRSKATEIKEITKETKKLVEEMVETLNAHEGMGLAAPQVHQSVKLFIIRTPIEKDQKVVKLGKVKVFINPFLSLPSEKTWTELEGCLSLPNICASVERPKEVTVEYTTLEGKKIKERVSGWQAKVIFHEYDHLQGILFIDRLNQEEKGALMPSLQNLEKKKG